MKKLLFFLPVFIISQALAQKSCASDPIYRQFDFWVGNWEAYAVSGKKAGDSKISNILDSCVVLEEWISTGIVNGTQYAGKSYNIYNAASRQWQQTWVDNTGNSIAYTKGKFENNKIEFETDTFPFSADTVAIRRLTFFNLGPDRVRQWGQITKDHGNSWATEYDLDYRRKK